MGTQPKKATRRNPVAPKKDPRKGVADVEHAQNLLKQVSEAQKPVRPATGRKEKKGSGKVRNGADQ
eukprot:5805152-Pyramimonas_sp.AAC.1